MSNIHKTINVNVKPGKKLTEAQLDALIVDDLDELPYDIRNAIKESIQS